MFTAPFFDQHNDIYKEILSISDDEIAELFIEHAITNDTDLPEISSFYWLGPAAGRVSNYLSKTFKEGG